MERYQRLIMRPIGNCQMDEHLGETEIYDWERHEKGQYVELLAIE